MMELPQETIERIAWALLNLKIEWGYCAQCPDSQVGQDYKEVCSLLEELQDYLAETHKGEGNE